MLLTFQPLRRSPLFLHIFSFIEQLFTDHILCVWSAIHIFPLPLRNGSKSITKIEVVINVYPVFCVQGCSYPFLLGNQTKVNIKINNWYNTSGLLENTVKLVHLSFQLPEQTVSWCKKNKTKLCVCYVWCFSPQQEITQSTTLKFSRATEEM